MHLLAKTPSNRAQYDILCRIVGGDVNDISVSSCFVQYNYVILIYLLIESE